MKNIIKFFIFCFVGGTSALIHLVVFNIFFKVLPIIIHSKFLIFGVSNYYLISTVFAIAISMIYNFSMNRNITFSARQEKVSRQLPKYLAVYLSSIGIGFLTSMIVLNLIGEDLINANIATISGVIVSIPVSFFGSLLWALKKRHDSEVL